MRFARIIRWNGDSPLTRPGPCAAALLASLLLALGGCETNSFIDPAEPGVVQPVGAAPLVQPILYTLDRAVEEPSTDFSNATDIKPEDLVVDQGDYRVGKNDLLTVSISDLLGDNTGETVKSVRVSETGTISLPFISPVPAEGLTEHELEDAITKAYHDAKLINQARVSVSVQEALARTYSIQGSVGSPGQYQIPKNDFRMLDVMVGVRVPTGQNIDYLYVLRKKTAPPPAPAPAPAIAPTGASPSGVTPGRPATDLLEPQGRTGDNIGQPTLLTDIVPSAPPKPATRPTTALLAPGDSDSAVGVVDGKPLAIRPTTSPTTAPFEFNLPPGVLDQRIIRVPIDPLRAGELKYNIVIKPGDMIIVPDPISGEYYMGGHVARGGTYSLNARYITLKQALVSAGGFDQLAIPQRTEIIRRIGRDREVYVRVDLCKVWAGEQPDVFLKPNDIVMVGTNGLAPFISAVRNGFRFTYGFGFTYDRNYDNNQNSNTVF